MSGGCHINDCHYNPEGNYDAYSMVTLCRKLLEHIGINPKRLRLEWVSAGKGIRLAQIMNEFSREMQELGPHTFATPWYSGHNDIQNIYLTDSLD